MKLLKYFKKRRKIDKELIDTADLFNWNMTGYVEWIKKERPERYERMIKWLKNCHHECCLECAAFFYMTDNAGGMEPACTMGGDFEETDEWNICKNCPLKDEQT